MLDEYKLQHFAELLETQQLIRLELQNMACEANRDNCKVKVVPAKKYTKVDVGTSGKYMIVNDTGEIYGIKAYGVIHRGHYYGTLDTVDQWQWGEYVAIKRVNY